MFLSVNRSHFASKRCAVFTHITVVTAVKIKMSNSSISIFQTLVKFNGNKNEDLSSWLRGFERCCVIAGKADDDLIKGQLLITCLCGSALAVADRLEEEKQTSQNFAALKAKLESVFNSDVDKELKQEEFEKRHLEINETEEELMNSLVKLHRSANPNSSEQELARNVKRKFLNGIPADLKRGIFIFCNDPHAATVSIDSLLEAVRKAKSYIVEQQEETRASVNAVGTNSTSSNNNEPSTTLLAVLEGLKQSLDSHIQNTSDQLSEQSARINALADRRNIRNDFEDHTARFNNVRGRSNQRGNNQRGRSRSTNSTTCYNCNLPNHIARDCRAPRAPPLN